MAAPTIESHNHNTPSGGTTATIAVTAAGAGRVIVVCATVGTTSGTTVPTLTISGGGAGVGAWTSIGKLPTTNVNEYALQAWFAVTSASVSAATVTVTSSITIDAAAIAYITVAGANTTQPLDQNSTLATGASNGSSAKYNPTGAMNATISTTTSNVLAFSILGVNLGAITPGSPTSGATVTESVLNSVGTNWATLGVFTQPFTTAQTGLALGSTTTSGQAWAMFAFGITADTQGGGGGTATNGFASAPFTTASTGAIAAGSVYLTKVTLIRAATAVAVLINFPASVSGFNCKFVIYDGSHSALLGASINATSLATGYNRIALASPASLAAGTYYVGYIIDTAGVTVSIDNTQTGSSWYVSGGQSVSSPPNPLVGGSSQNNGLCVALELDGSGAAYGFAPDYTSGVTLGGTPNTTATTTSAAVMGARSVVTQSVPGAGKWYAEVRVTGTLDPTNTNIGVIGACDPMSPPSSASPIGCVFMASGGNLTGNVSAVGLAYASGDVIGIAYNAGTQLIWMNKNGGTTWTNAGNPATGVSGFSTAAANWPVMVYAGSNTAATFTLRDTLGAQQYAAPAGFSAWSGGSISAGSQARAMVMA